MKYRVYATVAGSKYIGEFEALTKEHAKEIAWESVGCYVSLCPQCSTECEDAEVTELNAEEVEE